MRLEDYHRAIKSLWDGVCDVYTRELTIDEATGRRAPAEVKIIEGEPCRISYSSTVPAQPLASAHARSQETKLFIAKELNIPDGSKIAVTQEGRTEFYRRSGASAVYSCHQEITLEKFGEWA